MLEGHGDDLYKYEDIKYNFSSNVYHGGCPTAVTDHLREMVDRVTNYPSPSAKELNTLAADKFGLEWDQFLFTNGATEAFYMISQLYARQSATIVIPTFSEYQDACAYSGLAVTTILRSELEHHAFATPLAFICNPNNPDGHSISLDKLEGLLSKFPQTTFVIDEAYIEFSINTQSAVPLLAEYANLIIVKSMTKTFAIPGLRLGYIISSKEVITKLLTKKMPWSVNSLAIAAGQLIFEHYDEFLFDIGELIKEVSQFGKVIDAIPWLERVSSDTTYFLIRLKVGQVADLKSYLALEHQILIRDATNFEGLDGEYMRISLQSEEANHALIQALKTWK